jgi:hypothetical protein
VVDEIVTKQPEKYTSSAANNIKSEENIPSLKIPIGLGASDAEIRKLMPAGWNPGDPVDLPMDALLHYMGRSFFIEQGINLPESWKTGDPIPPEAMEILRKKFKLPEKRMPLYDDEVVDDIETLKKKRKLEKEEEEEEEESESDSDSSDSDSNKEGAQKISLSLSSDSESD